MSSLRLKIWYLFHYQINPYEVYLRTLNRHLPNWRLVKLYVRGSDKVAFGIAPETGPLMCGDEMCINDPNVSLDDPNDVYYSFSNDAWKSDLPKTISGLVELWEKTIAAYQKVISGEYREKACPACTHAERTYSGTGLVNNRICPTCFGLGYIYPLGPQKELGQRLLAGSDITISNRQASFHFQPDGLLAMLELYERYHTGIIWDIFNSVSHHMEKIMAFTFPQVDIRKLDKVLYLFRDGQAINLSNGQTEIIPDTTPKAFSEDWPSRYDWTQQVTFLRNLGLHAK